MKRAIACVMLSVFLVSVMSSTASAALLGSWAPSLRSVITSETGSTTFSSLIQAVATFEGTLQAYSVSGDPNVEEQVFLASEGISASLDTLNSELTEVYPNLSKEQQSAVKDAYLSLGSYLEKLAEEANQLFQDEDGKSLPKFEVQVGNLLEDIPLRTWGAAGGL
jgi:hypothetical protein